MHRGARKPEPMTRRRIGVISDTHSLLRPETMRTLDGVELIIHAGDVDTPAVLQALRALAPVAAVRGNADKGEWANGLPMTAALTTDEVSVYVLHNLCDLDLMPEAAGFRVVVSGHSHRPAIQERNGVLFLNPGSAGRRRFRLPVSMALLNVQGITVEAELVTLET